MTARGSLADSPILAQVTASNQPRCLVVGGGVIGLSVAVSLARAGAAVTILERGKRCGEGASAAAAGMLAVGAEVSEGGSFLELCRRGRALWPSWAQELRATTGVDCELERCGLVRVTSSEEGISRLERQRARQLDQGSEVSELLAPPQLAELVPGIGPSVLAGLLYSNDGHVHSHRFVDALVTACVRLRVSIQTSSEVAAIASQAKTSRLTLAGGQVAEADYVVVCAGSWSGQLMAEGGAVRGPVEPVRGQIVAAYPGRPLLSRIVFGDSGYLVQKRSGLVLAGATEEWVGYQPWPTLEGISGLIGMATQLIPTLAQARLAYTWAGLRPHVKGGRPLLGRLQPGGRVLLATAHFRNGVLLAPITGDLIARAILEGEDPPELAPFSPLAPA